jgi:uncharacterized membrane protein
MDKIVYNAIVPVHAVVRANRISLASQYITDTNFTNLLQNIDINKPTNFQYSLFSAFTNVPGLQAQVKQWIQKT